jgi:uncharacterized delta-60 repeat protein
LLVAALASACSYVTRDGDETPARAQHAPTAPSSAPTIDVDPIDPVVVGGSTELRVRVSANATGLRLRVRDLPRGVLADPEVVDLPAGVTTWTTRIAAATDAPQVEQDLGVSADGGGDPARVHLTVRGLPGAVDATFGEAGLARGSFGGDAQIVRALAVDARGRALVAGAANARAAVARYGADGRLDQKFGVNGRVGASFPAGSEAVGLVPLEGGLVAIGSSEGTDAVIHFVSEAGAEPTPPLRANLGFGGRARALVRTPADGRLLFGGDADLVGSSFALARFTTAGAPTVSQTPNVGASVQAMCSGAGRVFAVGTSAALPDPRGVVAAFSFDGMLDLAFKEGIAKVIFDDPSFANACATLPTGDVIVVGATKAAPGHGTVERYAPSGDRDIAFSAAHRAVPSSSLGAVAVDAAGRIVVAGSAGGRLFVARLLPSGAPDPTFGVLGASGADVAASGPVAVAFTPDGRILVVAQSPKQPDSASASSHTLVRFWN